MVHKIHLGSFMHECPVYWQNFMGSFHGRSAAICTTEEVLKHHIRINKHLESFNGIYAREDDRGFLQFVSKEDATYFILRWS